MEGYKLGWPVGEKSMLLVSVGTGRRNTNRESSRWAARQAVESLTSLVDDGSALVETIMQWLSNTQTPYEIDGEMGDLSSDLLSRDPLLTYLRYNLEYSSEWLKENISLDTPFTDEILTSMELIDNAADQNIQNLTTLGDWAADAQILESHFPASFEVN